MKMMQRIMAIMPGHISCEEFDEKLDDFLDGELSGWNRFRMWFHKLICRACALYAAGYAKTVRVLKSTFDDKDDQAADENVPEDLIQEILGHKLEDGTP